MDLPGLLPLQCPDFPHQLESHRRLHENRGTRCRFVQDHPPNLPLSLRRTGITYRPSRMVTEASGTTIRSGSVLISFSRARTTFPWAWRSFPRIRAKSRLALSRTEPSRSTSA